MLLRVCLCGRRSFLGSFVCLIIMLFVVRSSVCLCAHARSVVSLFVFVFVGMWVGLIDAGCDCFCVCVRRSVRFVRVCCWFVCLSVC